MSELTDQAVAEDIAEGSRVHRGRRGGWFEVRALMSDFDIDRLSDEAQARMTNALEAAGLSLQPSLKGLGRRDTVVLSAGNGTPKQEAVSPRKFDDVVTIRLAQEGHHLRRVDHQDLRDLPADGRVRWFDISNPSQIDPDELFNRVSPFCGGELTAPMVEDVLLPDPRPQVKEQGENAQVRCVSAFQVKARESDEGALPDSASKAGVLSFEPVEFLVGTNWMITCWHDIETYRGASRISESPANPRQSFFDEVARCWPHQHLVSAGDLALVVMHELALSFAPAYRQFENWQEEWELDFYRREDRIDRETLLEVRAAAAVLKDWLGPLNVAGMREDADRAWFPGITGSPEDGGFELALRIDGRIDRGLRNLRAFSGSLRGSYDLLLLRERERERERKRDDRFQKNVGVGGAVILIPTLVVGIMGANTWVPGQWREPGGPPHWAFLLLLSVVAVSVAVAYTAIRWLQARDEPGS